MEPSPARHPSSSTRWAAAGGAVLAAAAAAGASEATAALLDGVTSPLLAVADRAVDLAPRPVKEWAITTFGTADKPVLLGGVAVAVVLLAAAAGVVGARRPRAAVAGFLVLSAVAALAAVTDRTATAGRTAQLVPALVLAVVGVGSLALMLRAAGGRQGGRARIRAGEQPAPTGFDRRVFLRTALGVGAVAVGGGALAREYGGPAAAASRAALGVPVPDVPAPALPSGASLGVRGITPYLTPNAGFYRVDTALRVPDVPVDTWRLRLHGLVDRELELDYEELLSRRLVERRITLTCVSNPVGGDYAGNATWIGVPVADLLREAGVRPEADAVKSTSADDFTAGTPLSALLDEDRGALLAVAMNGAPLPLEHGFPVRLVTPGLYGYVSATKWLVDLEVTRFADFEAYWTRRGYAAQAPIKTSSRIDVPRPFAHVRPGKVPVAGVAWAQARGIERVEVRVDGGPWQRARLAAADGVDTWRQWVWDWDAEPGNHLLEVRATDATGVTQTGTRAPIAPDGATGWHSVSVSVG